MYEGWTVERAGDHTDLTVWYGYTVRGGLLGEMAPPLVAHRTRSMMQIITSSGRVMRASTDPIRSPYFESTRPAVFESAASDQS